MAVDIVKNGIVAELTDPKIVRNGVVEDINYIYSCKGGADSLVWQREGGTDKIFKKYIPNIYITDGFRIECGSETTGPMQYYGIIFCTEISLNPGNTTFCLAYNKVSESTGADKAYFVKWSWDVAYMSNARMIDAVFTDTTFSATYTTPSATGLTAKKTYKLNSYVKTSAISLFNYPIIRYFRYYLNDVLLVNIVRDGWKYKDTLSDWELDIYNGNIYNE